MFPVVENQKAILNDEMAQGHDNLKQLILDAAAEIGLDGTGREGLLGYLKYAATAFPKNYLGLLSKVMPLQIDSRSTVNVIEHVNIVSVPSDRYMPPKVIEHASAMIPESDPGLMTIEDVLSNPIPVDLTKEVS
jgi:hypothetical protein